MGIKCEDCIIGESRDGSIDPLGRQPVFESEKKDFNEVVEYGHDRGLLRYVKHDSCPVCGNTI